MTTFDGATGQPIKGARFRSKAVKVKAAASGQRRTGPFPPASRFSGLGDYSAASVGALAWEWLNPTQVQAEYVATGQTPPTVEQIQSNAVAGISSRIADNTTGAITAAAGASQWLIIGMVALVALELICKLPKGRRE